MVGGIGVRGHPRPLVSIWFSPRSRSRHPPSGISHAPHPWQRSRIGIAPPDRQGKCGQGCPRTRVEPTHAETRWCESVIPVAASGGSGNPKRAAPRWRGGIYQRVFRHRPSVATGLCGAYESGGSSEASINQGAMGRGWGAKRGVGLRGMPGTRAKRILIRGDGEGLGCRSRTVQSPGDQLHEVGYVRLVQARR